jgi:hypothetical protein
MLEKYWREHLMLSRFFNAQLHKKRPVMVPASAFYKHNEINSFLIFFVYPEHML